MIGRCNKRIPRRRDPPEQWRPALDPRSICFCHRSPLGDRIDCPNVPRAVDLVHSSLSPCDGIEDRLPRRQAPIASNTDRAIGLTLRVSRLFVDAGCVGPWLERKEGVRVKPVDVVEETGVLLDGLHDFGRDRVA